MNGDLMPIGGHKRKYDPAYAKKIKEGGKLAKKIHEETVAKHKEEDIPQAEENLLADLEQIENPKIEQAKK
jgi:hypothetical protein